MSAEAILKDRKEILDLLKELKANQGKVIKAIGKVKAVELQKLIDAVDLVKKYEDYVATSDKWIRVNNELFKKVIEIVASKLRLTSEERDTLTGED